MADTGLHDTQILEWSDLTTLTLLTRRLAGNTTTDTHWLLTQKKIERRFALMTDDLSIGHPAAATKRSQQHKRSEDRTAAAFSTKYRSSFATVICSISASDSQVNTPIQFSRWERFCTLVPSDLHLYYQQNQNLALCHKHSRHRSGREEEKNKVL